jgi:hypothetical protein
MKGAGDLGEGGHLLVWSWRRMVAASPDCTLLALRYAGLCGDDAPEVIATLCTFLQALGYAGRRRLRVGSIGSEGITADERRLLNLVGAALAGNRVCVEAQLIWLARPEARQLVAIMTFALADALAAHQLPVTPPVTEPPPSPGHRLILKVVVEQGAPGGRLRPDQTRAAVLPAGSVYPLGDAIRSSL